MAEMLKAKMRKAKMRKAKRRKAKMLFVLKKGVSILTRRAEQRVSISSNSSSRPPWYICILLRASRYFSMSDNRRRIDDDTTTTTALRSSKDPPRKKQNDDPERQGSSPKRTERRSGQSPWPNRTKRYPPSGDINSVHLATQLTRARSIGNPEKNLVRLQGTILKDNSLRIWL